MLAESYIVPQCEARPGTFGGLLTLYESNFIKLHQLIPGIMGPGIMVMSGAHVSPSLRDQDLHLRVDSMTRYTVNLRLTYFFAAPAGLVPDPDLQLRVFLDARMVEVLGWAICHRHEVLRTLATGSAREIDRRWSRNMMLSKWLDYLADMGHSFARL